MITEKDMEKKREELRKVLKGEKLKESEKQIEEDGQIVFSDLINNMNKLELVKDFVKTTPIYYDKGKLMWWWNNGQLCWERVDNEDLLNFLDYGCGTNIIHQKDRSEIINALKQVGRRFKPKEVKKTWVQFNKEIIDIKTGKRFKATPEYFVVNKIPYEIGEDDKTPKMDKLFKEWVGADNVKTLYQIIAYCLLADYPLQRLFCLIGSGSNGKSCFVSLIKKFLGSENCSTTDLDILLKSRFETRKLHKKLACFMGETNFNELSRTSILKRLTGRDLMGFEYKGGAQFDDYSYAKIIIATNNLPTTTDKTDGFYRRWFIVDFPNKFSEKRDVIEEIPDKEFKNLAYKSIEILKELLDVREFHKEGDTELRKKRYEDKSNPLGKFWKENIVEDLNSFVFKYEFRNKLKDFCIDLGFREISDTAISKQMKEKEIVSVRKQAELSGEFKQYHAWAGIKFKSKT